MKRELSLVIPCHNSEQTIEASIQEYYKTFSNKFEKLEMIIVCNACTDNTFEKCKGIKLKKAELHVLDTSRRGKGYALGKGFKQAQYDIIGFLDADNPFDLVKILDMIAFLERYEMVIVTKFKKGDLKIQSSFLRRIFSIGGAVFSRLFFDLNFKDTQAGAKFMRKQAFDRTNKNFICNGFEFDIELLYKMKKTGASIKEFFILPNSSDFSTVKLRILPGILYRLFKLRFQG